MLSPTHLRRLFTGLRDVFDLSSAAEITLEANPATFTERTAALYLELGVGRVSLGAQSFDPTHLATLGREHAPDDIAASVRLLRQAGMPEVNIDLIFSIPGQTLDDWRGTLEAALALNPQHLSAYNLTYEEDTPYFEQLRAGIYRDVPDLNAEMFTLAHELLTAAGFVHYETSNYARPGFESRHNRGYWHGADYLGLGPSAVSTIKARRWKNVPDTARYLHQIAHVGHAESEVEDLRPDQLRLERIALLLRTAAGVPVEHLCDVDPARIRQLTSEGLATIDSHHLRLTAQGPLLVDSIVEHLVTG
jgi:oxygen-independent coproporphyrinogen-3 oxidase